MHAVVVSGRRGSGPAEVIEALIRGAVAGYGIAVPVGAVAILIIEAGLRHGWRVAQAAAAGTATADGVYALVAAAFGTALAGVLGPIERPLRAVAALALVAIAVGGMVSVARARARGGSDLPAAIAPGSPPAAAVASPIATQPAGSRWSPRRTYLAFLGVTLANPMTVIYFAALIIGLQATGTGVAEKGAFVVGAFVASLSWQSVLAVAGAILRRRLGSATRALVGLAGNLIVAGFACVILAGLVSGP